MRASRHELPDSLRVAIAHRRGRLQNRLEMAIRICPVCLEVNSDDAKTCGACGASMRGGDTVPAALYMPAEERPAARKGKPSGALWFDDLKAQPDSPTTVDSPAPLTLTLRDVIDEPAPPPAPSDVLTPPDVVVADPEPPAPPDAEEMARRRLVDQLAVDRGARAAAKAAKRAAVRRARLGLGEHDPLPAGGESTVLVLDTDEVARDQLVALLVVFGFNVHATDNLDEALALSRTQPFAAAFVDVVLDSSDGGAGVDLCQRLKRNDLHADGRTTALVLVSTQERPSDRVLSRLAGCDGSLVKPLTRGSVARLLESCGVVFPADARRASR